MEALLSDLPHAACVASNSSLGYVQRALQKTGLDRYFGEHVFSAHQIGVSKPAPDLFLHAAGSMGYEARNCLVVEDSPSGVLAAQRAGMRVVGFTGAAHFNTVLRDRLNAAHADVYCSSVAELRREIAQFSS